MRFTRAKSLADITAMGFEPCSETAAVMFRNYGVPLYQRGVFPIEGTSAKVFVPRWAARAINEWPLRKALADEDFDHELLKTIIRRVVHSGDEGFATAACAVAMLDGQRGVTALLAGQ